MGYTDSQIRPCLQLLPMMVMGHAASDVTPGAAPQLTLDGAIKGLFDSSTTQAVQTHMFPQTMMPPVSLGGSNDLTTDPIDIVKAADDIIDTLW